MKKLKLTEQQKKLITEKERFAYFIIEAMKKQSDKNFLKAIKSIC